MPDYHSIDLINFANDKNAVDFKTAFSSIMSDKLGDALESKRNEVIQQMANPQDEDLDDEISDDEDGE